MRDLTEQELNDLINGFYSTQEPMDLSKGTIVDRFIARKMNVPLEEILNRPFSGLIIVDWCIMSYLDGKIPDKDTGKYIWECPDDLEWYENEKRKEEEE